MQLDLFLDDPMVATSLTRADIDEIMADRDATRRHLVRADWRAVLAVRRARIIQSVRTGRVVDLMARPGWRAPAPEPDAPADVVPFGRRIAGPIGGVDGPGGFAA